MTIGVRIRPNSMERMIFKINPKSMKTPEAALSKMYMLIAPKLNLPYRKYIPVQKDMSIYALKNF